MWQILPLTDYSILVVLSFYLPLMLIIICEILQNVNLLVKLHNIFCTTAIFYEKFSYSKSVVYND